MPLISVIVPVYNSSEYLKTCIDSILAQTFIDFELILIDDGSTDNSGQIIDDFATKDNRIFAFHQTNSGQAAARNFGIKKAKSEWICFIDSDDVVNPYYLEFLYKAATENKVSMSICNIVESDVPEDSFFQKYDYLSTTYNIDEENMMLLEDSISGSYWTIWSKLIKKEIVLSNLFTEGKIYEDNVVAPKWLYDAKRVAIIDVPLYFYTINETGTTQSDFSEKKIDLLWALEQQLSFLDSISFSKMKMRILMMYMDCVDSMLRKMKEYADLKIRIKEFHSRSRKNVKKYCANEKLNSNEKNRVNAFLHPLRERIRRKLFN